MQHVTMLLNARFAALHIGVKIAKTSGSIVVVDEIEFSMECV
jgi:hypothetical protein